ncbi:MAG: c-type cytochrome, partial [Bdellovibrio sp.]
MASFKDIDLSERKVLFYAFTVSAVHLLLIALAVIYLGINVPTCQPNEKLYTQGFIRSIDPKYIEVHYLARMWQFEPKKLIVPVGTKVDFFLSSVDVIHGFHINHTNVNLMAVPGVINKATHIFAQPGIYHIVCHEYCGMGHQNMTATIEASDYALAVTSDLSSPIIEGFPTETAKPISVEEVDGRKLFETKGCIACHSLTGAAGVGPTLKNVIGQQVELEGGKTVTVDEAYIIESITKPQAKIVKGFSQV